MNLGQWSVRNKVLLPVWIMAAFVVLVVTINLVILRGELERGHVEKVRALVESARSITEESYRLAKDGTLSEDAAKDKARDAIRAMIFNGGARVFVFDETGNRVVSNTVAEEGTSAWGSRHTQDMIRNGLNGGGVTYYKGARTLDGVTTRGRPKAAWSEHFAPWGWVISSAVYLDDVSTSFWNHLLRFALIFGAVGVLLLLWVNAIVGSITGPVLRLTANMKQLADGDTHVTVEDTGRADEIGQMAAAMRTFVSYEQERHALHGKLQELAFSDSLTGLANRASFQDRLQCELDRAAAGGTHCALIVVDLDRFKTINDTMGHAAGDAVLVQTARRIESAVCARAFIGRLAGDEFFVVLPDLPGVDEAMAQAHRLVEAMRQPMMVEDAVLQVSVSTGVAAGPGDSASAPALFRFADLALYDAKQAGGNCARAYRTQMGETIEKRFKLETMMNGALKRGEFKAAFQLKMDLATGYPAGAEALCRWVHPCFGNINPAEFIPVAEETGQIIAIGNMMLREACKFAVQVNHASARAMVIAVNVSPRQLMNGDFLIRLRDCLAATGCQPEWLELEITESLLLGEGGGVHETLELIAAMGIGIAIDDFGTGYSALSYLHRFPITALKIDRSFMNGICSDPQQEILVRTILAMAHGLGLETTAEGIETEDVARKLASMNCRFGQGYLWHRPAPADETSGVMCGLAVA